MIKLKNHHQPFLFLKEDKIKLITSKLMDGFHEVYWGESSVKENRWQLHLVDHESNEEFVIKTPKFIELDGENNEIICECNASLFREEDGNYRLSYVAGIHNHKVNSPLKLKLIECNLNLESLEVTFPVVINDFQFSRSAFKNPKETVGISKNKLIVNYKEDVDLSEEFSSIERVNSIWGLPKKYIISGKKTTGEYKTIIYDYNLKTILVLNQRGNSSIYKSSILPLENKSIFAWTEMAFGEMTYQNSENFFLYVDDLEMI